MTKDRPSVVAAVVAGIGVVAVGITGLVYELVLLDLSTCGGDGGMAYAAPDSPQGHLCSVLDGGGYTALVVGELAAVLVAVVLLAAWVQRRARGGTVVAVAVSAVLLPFVSLCVLSAPADQCSAAETAKYEKWQSQDPPVRATDPPNECWP